MFVLNISIDKNVLVFFDGLVKGTQLKRNVFDVTSIFDHWINFDHVTYN